MKYDELIERSLWIAQNVDSLAGQEWFVPWVRAQEAELVDAVAKGIKPYALIRVLAGKEVTQVEYDDAVRACVLRIKSIPKISGTELWLTLENGQLVVHFGLKSHHQAYLQALKWKKEKGMQLRADALLGLVFGYPEDRIACFLRWRECDRA